MKVKEMFASVKKIIRDFITDKNDDGDEKRLLGIASILIGFYYGLQPNPDSMVLWAYFGFGGTLLGVSAYADKIPRNISYKDSPEDTKASEDIKTSEERKASDAMNN